jgi:TonB family protein
MAKKSAKFLRDCHSRQEMVHGNMLTLVGVNQNRSVSQLPQNGGVMLRRCFASSLFLILSVSLSAQEKFERVRVTQDVMEGLVVNKVAPVYPPLARQARIQGTVIAQVVISKTGDVQSVQLYSGHPMLAPAALDAIQQWKFRPYELNGEPVDVETQAKVVFTLAGNPPAPGTVGSVPGGIPQGEAGGIANTGDARDQSSPPPQRVRVSQGVEERLSLKKVPPKYPEEARSDRVQGTVLLRVIVSKQGNVAEIGLISGHPELAPAAIKAVKQWKYRPYLLNQQPVEVETQVKVNFTLAQ